MRPRQRVTPSPLLPILDSRLPSAAAPAFDLMRVPLVGRFLRWRLARPAMQLLMMALAAVVIFDGLNGPQVGANESGWHAALDSLARTADLEPFSGRQCVLHGLPIYAAA